jgi:hypothetical protein
MLLKIDVFLCEDIVPTIQHTYISENRRTFGQTIRDKSVMLLGTPLGNTFRTWEHVWTSLIGVHSIMKEQYGQRKNESSYWGPKTRQFLKNKFMGVCQCAKFVYADGLHILQRHNSKVTKIQGISMHGHSSMFVTGSCHEGDKHPTLKLFKQQFVAIT